MNVDTNIDAYLDLIRGQKEMLQRAMGRQGHLPLDRKSKPQLYLEFMLALSASTVNSNRQGNVALHSSFIPIAYLPCTTPLSQLTPITIRQLRLETHHRGKYLLLQAITPPNRMTGILVLGADVNEDAVILQMYQQEEEKLCATTEIVDTGTVLLVKEPYYKRAASGDYAIRVDHLSDVVRIEKRDPLFPECWTPRIYEIEETVESLKSQGDESVREGKW
jgi:hypothetical protein